MESPLLQPLLQLLLLPLLLSTSPPTFSTDSNTKTTENSFWNFCNLWQLLNTCGNLWQFWATHDSFWQSLRTFATFYNFWQPVKTYCVPYGNVCQLLETFVKEFEAEYDTLESLLYLAYFASVVSFWFNGKDKKRGKVVSCILFGELIKRRKN